mgnify:CR=1 FL=1
MKFNEFVDRLNERACKFAGVGINTDKAKEILMNAIIKKYVLFIDREPGDVFTVEVMAHHFTKEDDGNVDRTDIVFYADEEEETPVAVFDWGYVIGVSECYKDEEIQPQLLLGQWEKQEGIDGHQNNS